MGIQINGQTDNISAVDGSLTISGAELPTVTNLNATGIVTATGFVGNLTGTASTATVAATAFGLSGSPTLSGITSVSTTNLTVNGNAYPSDGVVSGARNRIINGDMRIDQRNNGASVTAAANYTLDRWIATNTQSSKYSVQRSTTAPTGFSNSLLVTSLSAYSVVVGDFFLLRHYVEGFNFSDLNWGSVSAKTITLSFWVRSSLTGVFGGSLQNSAENRSYPFSYTISAADTWEQKSITIVGDASGTWVGATNGIGVRINFGLGAGATYGGGTAGAWVGSDYRSVTGATSVVGTNGATFYITGVQLEAGTVATPFERRSFGQELALCQRYFEKSYDIDTAVGTNTSSGRNWAYGTSDSAGSMGFLLRFATPKRAQPTMTYYTGTGTVGSWSWSRSGTSGTSAPGNGGAPGANNTLIYMSVGTTFANTVIDGHWTASAEL
jgi:hypothetical protein